MLILEHSYWLKFWSNQSECLKMSIAQFYAENISTGLGPVLHQIHGYAFQSHLPNRQIAFLEVIRFPNSGFFIFRAPKPNKMLFYLLIYFCCL